MNKAVSEIVKSGRGSDAAWRARLGGLKLLALALCLVASLGVPAAAGAKTSVLLLPFTINAAPENAKQLQSDLPALLRQSLTSQGFSVITGRSGTQDPSRAKEMARQAGTQFAVYGTFNQVGDSFSINMRLVEAHSAMLRPYSVEKGSLLELPAAVSQLAAQAYTGAINKNALANVTVRGLNVIDPDRVLVRVASRTGDPVNVDSIDEDVRRIWDMGYFSDVTANLEPSAQGDVLVFHVVEKPRIDDVRVQGSKAVKIGDITEAMSSRTGTVLNEKLLADDLQKIAELYRKKGFYLADVKYDILTRPDGASAALVLNVTEGSKLYIREVLIEGLQEVRAKDIKSHLALKKRGIFSWLTGTGVLKEDLLERDAQAIQAYLVNLGYVDAQVSAPDIRYDDKGITVVFTVKEGVRYKLGEIGFHGDLLDTEDNLYSLIKLDEQRDKKDGYFNLEVMQADIKRLTELYNDKGYAFANIGVDTEPASEGILNVTYLLEPREKVYIRRMEVEGNTKTRDNVIIREMRLADGQEFRGDALRRSSERLDKLRYFDDVDTQLVPTGTPGEVDLKVDVKEGKTGMINVGFGYSTYDKFGVSGGIKETNLFGRGYSVGLSGYLSSKESSLNAFFTNPRIYDTNLGFTFNAYAIEQEWSDFDKRTVGSSVLFFYPLGEYTSVRWGYRLEQYELYNVAPFATRTIRDHVGNNWASVANVGLYRDTTNSAAVPTRGIKSGITLEYGGGVIGGDDDFFKPVVDWGIYRGLNDTNVLHARAAAGAVFRNTSHKVPVFERFFLGGMNTIRGYSHDDISPRDLGTGESIGADRMAYANFEYIWHFKPDLGLALVPFFDVAWATDSRQNDFFDKTYYSTGLELRWRSPMGDLRFAYGWPLTKNVLKESRSSGRFEFSMGQAF